MNDALIRTVDGMASQFLFLDNRTIDIPAAGQLINQLESLAGEAAAMNIEPLRRLAAGLTALLEKIVLDDVREGEAAFLALEKGITLMQEICTALSKTDVRADVDIGGVMAEIARLAGDRLPGGETAAEAEAPRDEKPEIRDESLLKDFIIEGLEYINEIEVNILNLEQNPEDKDCVNAIFRPFHSIKGVAGFLNLDNIRDLAHNLENLLDKVRKDALPVTPGLIDVILDGADALKALIGALKDELDGRPGAAPDVDLRALTARIRKTEEGQGDGDRVKKLGEILVEDGVLSENALVQALERSREEPAKKIGETLIEEGKATPKQVSQALRKQAGRISETTAIRVDTSKLDDLIDMVGELVITQSMIRQNPDVQTHSNKKLSRDIAQLCSITSELQRTSTSLRMVPIKQTFQRVARLVRDLSKASGKSVNVVLMGEETEIDRNMVEEIYNPLVHLIRNAVDHGIETPRERIERGKPEAGTIHLKAYHRGGTIVIEIADDGRGLDRQRILDKAVREGAADANAHLTEQEVFRLIFLPGLSTAAKVTDVSGRGVGMDVVKKAIDKLRGKIDILSTAGAGTTFVASFPLTLAIIDGMIVKVGGEKYVMPTSAIRQLLRPEESSCSSVAQRAEMISVRGKLLPLVRLHELFGVASERKKPWETILMVVDSDNRSKCFMVDEILGKEEVVIKGLGEGLKATRGVSGGAILGDGNIGLILDPEGLFELSEMH